MNYREEIERLGNLTKQTAGNLSNTATEGFGNYAKHLKEGLSTKANDATSTISKEFGNYVTNVKEELPVKTADEASHAITEKFSDYVHNFPEMLSEVLEDYFF